MGLFTRQLLCYRCLDESPHGAKVYILDMDHELSPGVYAWEPDPGFDRSQAPEALCSKPLRKFLSGECQDLQRFAMRQNGQVIRALHVGYLEADGLLPAIFNKRPWLTAPAWVLLHKPASEWM